MTDSPSTLKPKQKAMIEILRQSQQVIELWRKQIKNLTDLCTMYIIALLCDVEAKEIKSTAYCSPMRKEWERWPKETKKLLPWSAVIQGKEGTAHEPKNTRRVVNRVKLKDGTEIKLAEPILLDYFDLDEFVSNNVVEDFNEDQD